MTDFQTTVRSAVQTQRRGRPLLLFLDYDGTLVDIAPRPELARPTLELLKLLETLVQRRDFQIFVVSGRPLQELQDLLPVMGLNFLGSHGGEALIAGRPYPLQVATADSKELFQWRSRLAEMLQPFRGWWIEDKPLGFALHYRQVPESQLNEMTVVLGRWQEQLRQEGSFQILAGKRVVEILPFGVSKGAAIQEILLLSGFLGFFPVYLGDDVTDEGAFRILQDQGLTIKVGHPGNPTAAAHHLPNPRAVKRFLALLAMPPEEL